MASLGCRHDDLFVSHGTGDSGSVISPGGYTAAALAGARIDPRILSAILAGTVPLPEVPEFPGALEALRTKHAREESSRRALDDAAADLSDARVARAVFTGGAQGRRSTSPRRVAARPAPTSATTTSSPRTPPSASYPAVRVRAGRGGADFFRQHLT